MLFEDPHPDIPFEKWKLHVPTTPSDWLVEEGIARRASINSFGYGGANAHVILEEHSGNPYSIDDESFDDPAHSASRPWLIPVTSHSEIAGNCAVASLYTWLCSHPDTHLYDLAQFLTSRRSNHKYRSYFVSHTPKDLLKQLSDIDKQVSWSPASRSPRVCFVFTGQGAQASGMGRQLFDLSPGFQKSILNADAVLKALPDGPAWSLMEELFRPEAESNLKKSAYSQPLCTALQLALVDLLMSWGLAPSAVCGHSSGEIAAAYACRILSFRQAMTVAYYRGLHMGNAASGTGGMLAVGLGEADALAYVKNYEGRLVVAAINSPQSITISGDEDAIEQLQQQLLDDEIFVRRLQVEQAFHSHHMVPLAPQYRKSLESSLISSEAQHNTCQFFSSVTGDLIGKSQHLDPTYWAENMVKPVQFEAALSKLLLHTLHGHDQQDCILIEIGPHPALRGPTRQILTSLKKKALYVATLHRDQPSFDSLLGGMGRVYSSGVSLDLKAINSLNEQEYRDARVTQLPNFPTYSWNHQRPWSQTRVIRNHLHHGSRHTVLGVTTPASTSLSPRWRNYLRLSELPWLNEHVFDGTPLFPGAAYVTMAIEAAIRANPIVDRRLIRSVDLKEINIKAPMSLTSSEIGTEVYTELRHLRTSAKAYSDSWHEFAISSYNEEGNFTEHCTGLVSLRVGEPRALESSVDGPTMNELAQNAMHRVKTSALYQQILENGLFLGERFALTKNHIMSGTGYIIAPTVEFLPSHYTMHERAEGTFLYPTILDNCFQSLFIGIENHLGKRLETVFVPTFIESLQVSGLMEHQSTSVASQFSISTKITMPNNRTAVGHVSLHQNLESQPLVLEVKGLEMTAMGDTSSRSTDRRLFFNQPWQPCFDMLKEDIKHHFQNLYDAIGVYQFQHPHSTVLIISPNSAACNEILPYIDELFDTKGGFKSVHIHLELSFKTGLEDTNLRSLPEITMVEEPGEGYDLVISLNPAFDWHELIKWTRSSTAIMTSYALKSDPDWGTVSTLTSGGSICLRNKPSRPVDDVVVVTSTEPCIREQELMEKLKEEINVIGFVPLHELPNFRATGKLRYLVTSSMSSTADDWNVEEWGSVQYLLGLQNIEAIWLLDEASPGALRPQQALVAGLLHVARNENTSSRFITLKANIEKQSVSVMKSILKILVAECTEEEFVLQNETLYITRVLENKTLNSQLINGIDSAPILQPFDSEPALSLQIGKIGLLETLHFSPDHEILSQPLKEDEIEIRIMASALNFRDIAATMGLVQDRKLGDECAGVVHRLGSAVDTQAFSLGDRVLACRPGQGAHGTFVRQPVNLCVKIPENFSYTVAASWSGVLTTAMYALNDVAHLQPGETILIHSGSGGVGQMAIQLAQKIGAHVLTTCSDSKRAFLQAQFGLSSNEIFSSRDDSFVMDVMKATKGRGADVILNSLAGKLLTASWDCIAPFGRFVEIGKRDIHQNANLPMAPFRRNVLFASVDLVMLYETQPKMAQRILEASAELIHSGEILPASPISEFSYAEVEQAMRLMQKGKHLGKIVMTPHPNDMVPVVRTQYQEPHLFNPHRIYLIVGGLGGLGGTVAEWMVRRGCRRILSFSRSGDTKETAQNTVCWLRQRGIEVQTYRGDITIRADVERCIASVCSELAGIFFAPMALEDSLICNMTHEQWQRIVKVKCHGAEILHDVTIAESCNLDFFIAFSSTSAVTGNKGQANYAASNAYLDALMEVRQRQGLPGVSMNVGAVMGVGVAENNTELLKSLKRMKHDMIKEHELLLQIDEALKLSFRFKGQTHEGSHIETAKLYSPLGQERIITGINVTEPDVFWAQRSRFRNLYVNRTYGGGQSASIKADGLIAALSQAKSTEERVNILLSGLIKKISVVMGVSVEELAPSQSLAAHGLDSIVAVELRKWLQDSAGVDVSLFDIINMPSIHGLVQKALAV
jgi:acyl transferase domain-containing protein/NADPH:quinone reductase-like Zn-dependent oxidoreductase/NAD(P)-dependent dehydrogenase (short-subunit alcohol dehydrogenase family)/aryl carrier-like protein